MALQAGKEVLGDGPLSISEIEVLKPMILRDHQSRVVQATLTVDTDGARLVVHSRLANSAGAAGASAWTPHATARWSPLVPADETPAADADIDAARSRCQHELDGPAFYAALATK